MKYKTWKALEKKHPELITLRSSRVWPKPDIHQGWLDLVDELMTEMKKDVLPDNFEVSQVKEKFGGLRFYCSNVSKNGWDIIRKYEEKSYTICEKCGNPGTPNTVGWIKTLCPICRKWEDDKLTEGQKEFIKRKEEEYLGTR